MFKKNTIFDKAARFIVFIVLAGVALAFLRAAGWDPFVILDRGIAAVRYMIVSVADWVSSLPSFNSIISFFNSK